MILKLGIRYFFSKNKDRTISLISNFSLAGVSLGVAALIIVMGIMRGVRTELLKNIIGLNSHIVVHNINEIHDIDRKLNNLLSLEFVEKYILTSTGEALLKTQDTTQGIMVKGISLDGLKKKFPDSLWVNQFSEDDIAISDTLKKQLHLEIAEPKDISKNNKEISKDNHDLDLSNTNERYSNQKSQINLISAKLNKSILGSLPKSKTFDVNAIFNSGIYEYDAKLVFIDLNIAKILFQSGLDLEIYVNDPEEVKSMTTKIANYFDISPNSITNWHTQNISLIKAMEIEKISMFAILFLLIMISGFNIIASITILVKDKIRDIAILKTIGMSNFNIWSIFFINGFLIGVFGVTIGSVAGIVIGINLDNLKNFLERITSTNLFDPVVYFLYHLPCNISLYDVLIVNLASLGLCSIVAFYPSYKAYKLNIIDAIRSN